MCKGAFLDTLSAAVQFKKIFLHGLTKVQVSAINRVEWKMVSSYWLSADIFTLSARLTVVISFLLRQTFLVYVLT